MKRFKTLFLVGLIIGGVTLFLVLSNCGPQKKKSAEKNSYYEVTSKLDQGGEFFLYLSTEKIIEAAEKFAMKVRGIIEMGLSKSQSKGIDALNIFDFIFGKVISP